MRQAWKYSAEDYREAALERLKEGNNCFAKKDYVAVHLSCGLAVECMLRAYKRQVSEQFDERHNVIELSKAFVDKLDAPQRRNVQVALNEVAVLWTNNHRYCSPKKLRSYFARIDRYSRTGNILSVNAQAMLALATEIVEAGEGKWTP